MLVNTDNLISITEANQNFSKVARMVEEKGAAVILKNNAPRYIVIEFSRAERLQEAADEDVTSSGVSGRREVKVCEAACKARRGDAYRRVADGEGLVVY